MYIVCFDSVQHHTHYSLKVLLIPLALPTVVPIVAEVIVGAIVVLAITVVVLVVSSNNIYTESFWSSSTSSPHVLIVST
jgi:hypothetical protein